MCLLQHCICVSGPCEILSDVNAEELKAVYPLHRCLVDGDGCVFSALSPEIHHQLLGLVDVYLKASTGPLLDPLQFAYRANKSVADAVNMGPHFILQHLDRPETYVRILFVDFRLQLPPSSDTLQNNLTQLSPSSSPSVSGSPAS